MDRLISPIKFWASSVLRLCTNLLKKKADFLSNLAADLDFKAGYLEFRARPDDIFIVTYPRSGTTWMQMILYQISTNGKMDFSHIYEVSPWFERMLSYNIMKKDDLESLPCPRVFKTHLPYQEVPKGAKYIYVARNGKDVAVSYYHLYKTHKFFKGSFDEFYELFMKGKVAFGSWFEHVGAWWDHRDDKNVLFLKYEDMLNNFEESLNQIITFCEFDVPRDRYKDIIEKCSFNFMKQHDEKFDPTYGRIWELSYQKDSFFRKGKTGEGNKVLSIDQKNIFDKEYERYLTPRGVQLNI